MWGLHVRSDHDTVSGHMCWLDRTRWFAPKPFLEMSGCETEVQKENYAVQLATSWDVDEDTARYYLFHEHKYKALANKSVLRYIQRKSEFELCIRWAVEMRNAVWDTLQMLRTAQSWGLDSIPADDELVKEHFGTAERSWNACWKQKMDPFDWKDFQGLGCPHRVRITVAALATARGASLHKRVKEEIPVCRTRLGGHNLCERVDANKIAIKSAAKVVDDWFEAWKSDAQRVMIRYVTVALLCAELQHGE
jgi:hypothetical protein